MFPQLEGPIFLGAHVNSVLLSSLSSPVLLLVSLSTFVVFTTIILNRSVFPSVLKLIAHIGNVAAQLQESWLASPTDVHVRGQGFSAPPFRD